MAHRFKKIMSGAAVARLMRGGVIALLALLMAGCTAFNTGTMNPGSEIADQEKHLFFLSAGIMLVFVLIPVYILATYVAWAYRKSAKSKNYAPEWCESKPISMLNLFIPVAIILVLGTISVSYTYALDPYRPATGAGKTVRVQAVALDWKWLFIYPDEGIAVINEAAMPVGAPVDVRITSATTMNSMMFQGLSPQIYTMAGMESHLNFRVDRIGNYRGRNMQFSGDGFASQNFAAVGKTQADYDKWLANAKASASVLDATTFAQLRKQSAKNPVAYYRLTDNTLFDKLIASYASRSGTMAQNNADAQLCEIAPDGVVPQASSQLQ